MYVYTRENGCPPYIHTYIYELICFSAQFKYYDYDFEALGVHRSEPAFIVIIIIMNIIIMIN